MFKKSSLLGLFLLVASLTQATGPDPFQFISFEGNAQLIKVTPSSADTAVGSYAWASDQKSDGNVSLKLQNLTAGDWGFGVVVEPLVAGVATPVDLSSYQYITFDMYGDNSGRTVYMDFESPGNQAYWNVKVDFTGWKHFIYDKASASQGGGTPAAVWPAFSRLVIYDNGATTPANLYIDNIAATNVGVPDESVRLEATHRTVTVDGNASDWDLTAAQPTAINNALLANHNFAANIRYSWDSNFLYILIQEDGTCKYKTEPLAAADFIAGPWSFDCVSLWIDLQHKNLGQHSFNPWFGFSSTGATDLWICRVNNDNNTLVSTPFSGGAIATSGTFAEGNRTIEAKISWASIAASVADDREPAGGIVAAVKAGYAFGAQPLLVEKDWNGQDVIGGGQWVTPFGYDANSRTIVLSNTVPVELSTFGVE